MTGSVELDTRQHDRKQAEGEEALERNYFAALDDLVDRIMAGESWPKRGRYKICLVDILNNIAADDSSEIVEAVLHELGEPRTSHTLHDDISKLVKEHLKESKWVYMRAEEMIEDEREEHGQT